MTTPLITNIAPADGSVAAVGASSRFSVRDALTEINLSKLQLYRGTGPVLYRGETLPEQLDAPPTIEFVALNGSPGSPASREILVDDYLRITKNIAAQNQEAGYLMGGLEAPAEPDAPMMLEFTLRLNKTEVTVDGNFFTGVLVALFIGNKGLAIKFFVQAGTPRIEIHDASQATVAPPSGAYVASFDWDETVAQNADGSNTYKLLWHPQRDLVRLYVKDPDQVADQLLVTGAVSDFPTLPVPEQRVSQPWMFFGHGYPSQTSISEWIDVYLYNIVTTPIRDGIIGPEHITVLTTNNPTYYDGTVLPRDTHRAWQRLPASFGTYGGGERITQEGLVLERTSISESIGFFRTEPRVTQGAVLDFKLSGEVVHQEPLIETSGIEVYIDDGVRQARFALLQDAGGNQYAGILKNSANPSSIISYEATVVGFTVERNYRLVLTAGVRAELFFLVETEEGVEERLVLTVPYVDLPLTGMPGPGIGFLHNANSGGATAKMIVRQIRYTTTPVLADWVDLLSPTPSWTKVGAGTVRPGTVSIDTNIGADASITESLGVVTVSGLQGMSAASIGNYLEVLNGDNPGIYRITNFLDPSTVEIDNPAASGADAGNPNIQWREIFDPTFLRMSDSSVSDNTYFKKEFSPGVLQSDNGWSLEFRTRIVSYTHDSSLSKYLASGLNPIRASTGFMVQVLDGTNRTALIFADAGPPFGKIVFLALFTEPHENLLAIRAKNPVVVGSYSAIDWTKFHLYRLERTIGGQVSLYVDEKAVPVITFEDRTFDFPPHLGGGNSRVELGHGETGILTVSDFQLVKFATSDSYDVSCKPNLSDEELLTRFNHGVNVIIEAEDL